MDNDDYNVVKEANALGLTAEEDSDGWTIFGDGWSMMFLMKHKAITFLNGYHMGKQHFKTDELENIKAKNKKLICILKELYNNNNRRIKKSNTLLGHQKEQIRARIRHMNTELDMSGEGLINGVTENMTEFIELRASIRLLEDIKKELNPFKTQFNKLK